jgi:hypothetical protein
MSITLTTFLYLALAAWRIANLFCNEQGPFGVFGFIRFMADFLCDVSPLCRRFGLGELVSCEYCLSVWIGVGLTLLYVRFGDKVLYLAVPLALSTVVILLKYVHQYMRRVGR